jgi:predicted transcriptional regulator
MAYNPAQFKAKKKRVVDPNAPPRPNLLSHEKRMKESQAAFEELYRKVHQQAELIESLRTKFQFLEHTVNYIVAKLKGNK